MKNLQNKKFIHFKKDNEKKIKCDLNEALDRFVDLVVCNDYTAATKYIDKYAYIRFIPYSTRSAWQE